MLKKLVTLTFVCFVIAAGATVASAQWVKLGSKTVSDRVETDVIRVSALRGQFRSLRFNVSRRPVRFIRVEVTYENGEKDQLELRQLVRAGGQTRVIDLKGHNRFVRQIDFWYEAASLGANRSATVTAYGRR